MLQDNHEMGQEICVLYVTIFCPEQFHILKKIHHKHKSKGQDWAFRDFVFDCVQKMTEQEGREDEEVSADDESVASTLRASTAEPSKRPRVKSPAAV
jgi:hypothetical protein